MFCVIKVREGTGSMLWIQNIYYYMYIQPLPPPVIDTQMHHLIMDNARRLCESSRIVSSLIINMV